MNSRPLHVFVLGILFGVGFFFAPAHAVELVTNGNFESGDTGWARFNDATDLTGKWIISGALVGPFSGLPQLAPPQGANQAISDQNFVGTRILYQDVSIPTGMNATLSLTLWYHNYATYWIPTTFTSYNEFPVHMIRIDVMNPALVPNASAIGILKTVFVTQTGTPLDQPYKTVTADLSQFAGQSIRLRFLCIAREALTVGIDQVSLQADPPVPAANTTWGALRASYR